MKLSCVVAVTLLVLALCSQGQSQNGGVGVEECCVSYYSKQIPSKAIKDYKDTNPTCPKKGVILITVKDKRLCANPDEKPVQDILYTLQFGSLPVTGSR